LWNSHSWNGHHAAVTTEDEGPTLLEQAGFVACGDGPADLSTTYKDTLSSSLGDKVPLGGSASPGERKKKAKA